MSNEKDCVQRVVDWQKIELDYRAGIKTLRRIAGEHGISETAIRKRAKRQDWSRDLSMRIQAKADELVRKIEVRKITVRREDTAYREVDMVNVCGKGMAEVISTHRELSVRLVQFGVQLLDLAENDILDIEKRARTFKTIVDSVDSAVKMQRQAWGIDPKNGGHNAAGEGEGARFVVEKMYVEK